jgi:FlaA1/EpsC-like NDP-sugar epimerase
MSIDRAVELALEAAKVARGGEVFVFKMPVARLSDLVSAAIAVFAPRHGRRPNEIEIVRIPVRPGEKAYEELMTTEESLRARDIGPMYALLPSIDTQHDIDAAYRRASHIPVGAYRSDGVEPMDGAEVEAVLRDAIDGPEP